MICSLVLRFRVNRYTDNFKRASIIHYAPYNGRIHYAPYNGHTDTMRFLDKQGANVSTRELPKRTDRNSLCSM
jgi:hypothetical protein